MKIIFKDGDEEIVDVWSDYYDGVTDTWEIPQVPRRGDTVAFFDRMKRDYVIVTVCKVFWLSQTEVKCYVERT